MKYKNILGICLCILLAFIMAMPVIAQNTKTFKGVVLDETEQPVIGASVKVVGTTVGTITDLDGNFTLNVPDGKEVEISYIGYLPQRFSALLRNGHTPQIIYAPNNSCRFHALFFLLFFLLSKFTVFVPFSFHIMCCMVIMWKNRENIHFCIYKKCHLTAIKRLFPGK